MMPTRAEGGFARLGAAAAISISAVLPAFRSAAAGPGAAGKAIRWGNRFCRMHAGAAERPRAVQLRDGAVLAAFTQTPAGGKTVAVVRSTDGGRTWGGSQRVVQGSGSAELCNPFPVQLADGTVLLGFCHHLPQKRSFRLQVFARAANGKSWAARGTIAAGSRGLWDPFLLRLPDGTVQAYYAHESGPAGEAKVEMRPSRDGGKTWAAAVTVAQKRGSRDGKPAVVVLGDGTLLAVFEASDASPFRLVVRAVRSKDRGRTWSSKRELVYLPRNPAGGAWAAGAPSVVRLRDGRLLVSFQTDEDVSYRKGDRSRDPAATGYSYLAAATFKYVVSADDGRIWSNPVRLAGSPSSPAVWSALCVLRGGDVLALTGFRGRIWSRIGVVGR
jgi:hypothetical protein